MHKGAPADFSGNSRGEGEEIIDNEHQAASHRRLEALFHALRTVRSKTLLILCSLAATSLLGCSSEEEAWGDAVVERATLQRPLLLTGEIRTADSVELLAPMANMWPIPVRSIVEDGTAVEEGEVIAEFDSANLLGQLESSEQRLVQARADLESARAKADIDVGDAEFAVIEARSTLERARLEASIPDDLRSQREAQQAKLDLQRAELEWETAQAKLASQRDTSAAEVGVAEVEVQKARAEVRRNQSYTEVVVVRAPQAGIVEIAFNDDEGRPYRAGDNIEPGRVIARFPDYRTLQVDGFLFDVDQGALQTGTEAEVVLDAYPDRAFLGHVEFVQELAQQPNFRSSRRAFRVVIRLDQSDENIMRSGMSARALVLSLVGDPAEPPLVLAREALDLSPNLTTSLDRDDVGRVLARAHGRGGWVDVEVGRCSEAACVVVGPGEGDRFRRLRPASPVHPSSLLNPATEGVSVEVAG